MLGIFLVRTLIQGLELEFCSEQMSCLVLVSGPFLEPMWGTVLEDKCFLELGLESCLVHTSCPEQV
ncbi:hypothetical protein DPMN_173128 [Dreissena polymorpha]|uniref:Uncharacterized protein n=1 Tax=Dreissena polymorpha TaxID=45954 RepID=A0A9D4IFT1_DREPO|nr:hypothetical protein DPMN_173128 [Dreissena polymorpha]